MPPASTWNEREIPILEAVWSAEEAGDRAATGDIAGATGIERDSVARGIASLIEAGYLAGKDWSSLADRFPEYALLRLRERGRRAIGQWPPDVGESFLVALNRLIAAEEDPAERARLAKLRDAAADVGKQVLAGAVVAAGQAQLWSP
jgi:DNA-binding MarR family transcriptional regulator